MSLLSDQSEVFASMFKLPQGDEDGRMDVYEGMPLVRLPDTSEEVCALLDALRNPLCVLAHIFITTYQSPFLKQTPRKNEVL